MTRDNNMQNMTREKLKRFASKIPKSLNGIEKHLFIGQNLFTKLPESEIISLRQLLETFLLKMRQENASDIDIGGWGVQGRVWLRINGRKNPLEELGSFTTTESDILILSLLMDNQRKLLFDQKNLDFSYTVSGEGDSLYRYRADAYFDTNCLALNMRAINTDILAYESFGFHASITRALSLAHTKEGLILITGITGSGKSTTLDSIVDMNNRSTDGHVVIIASPIEYVHNSKKCLVRHREVGRDTLSFKSGTVEALRQDPDIIMIGEMRDPDTIMAALEAADSGHKVLSTLHTASAVESIARIVAEMPTNEQERVRNRLADTLRCVITQKLVPTLSGKRVLAKEIMLNTPSTRAAILNDNISEIYQMISQGNNLGMVTIEQDLTRLLLERKISLATAVNFANNKRRLEQILKLAKQKHEQHI